MMVDKLYIRPDGTQQLGREEMELPTPGKSLTSRLEELENAVDTLVLAALEGGESA